MTAAEFRTLALSVADAVESQHMKHPDFRVNGKVFASLGYPRLGWGMIKISLDSQEHAITTHEGVFVHCAGAWGKAGCTAVLLDVAPKRLVRTLLNEAGQLAREASKPRARRATK